MTQEEKESITSFLRNNLHYHQEKLRQAKDWSLGNYKISYHSGVLSGIELALSKLGKI